MNSKITKLVSKKIKIPPDKICLQAIMFARLANGGHQQTFRDEEWGITVTKLKENRDTPWRNIITMDQFGEKVFNSLAELKKHCEEQNENSTRNPS